MKPLQDLADRQWRDYRARQPGTCFADPDFVLSVADAYELQDAVAKLRVAAGDRLIGYKVGCTGTGTVQQFGMQGPIRGCLFKSEIRKDGDVLNLFRDIFPAARCVLLICFLSTTNTPQLAAGIFYWPASRPRSSRLSSFE